MNDQVTTTTSLKQNGFSDEQEVFNLLAEYINDMIKYRQLVFYVGTSCDNKRLRLRLYRLHAKLFRNVSMHSDTFKLFFQDSLTNGTSKSIERILSFTLLTLNFFSSLINKLVYLFDSFPFDEENEEVINLGFEDFTINEYEDTMMTTTENSDFRLMDGSTFVMSELNKKVALNDASIPVESAINPQKNFFIISLDDLENNCFKIHQLIEDIELLDTNLLRYNVRTNESNPFIKQLRETSFSKSSVTKFHFNLHQAKALFSTAAGANGSGALERLGGPNSISKKRPSNRFKLSDLNKYLKKRNFIVSAITIFALLMIIVLFGLIFGLQ